LKVKLPFFDGELKVKLPTFVGELKVKLPTFVGEETIFFNGTTLKAVHQYPYPTMVTCQQQQVASIATPHCHVRTSTPCQT
jgi:hypothetical protein